MGQTRACDEVPTQKQNIYKKNIDSGKDVYMSVALTDGPQAA